MEWLAASPSRKGDETTAGFSTEGTGVEGTSLGTRWMSRSCTSTSMSHFSTSGEVRALRLLAGLRLFGEREAALDGEDERALLFPMAPSTGEEGGEVGKERPAAPRPLSETPLAPSGSD